MSLWEESNWPSDHCGLGGGTVDRGGRGNPCRINKVVTRVIN